VLSCRRVVWRWPEGRRHLADQSAFATIRRSDPGSCASARTFSEARGSAKRMRRIAVARVDDGTWRMRRARLAPERSSISSGINSGHLVQRTSAIHLARALATASASGNVAVHAIGDYLNFFYRHTDDARKTAGIQAGFSQLDGPEFCFSSDRNSAGLLRGEGPSMALVMARECCFSTPPSSCRVARLADQRPHQRSSTFQHWRSPGRRSWI